MTQPAKRTLETLVGPLAQTLPQLERATILHSDQLTTERRTNPELRNQWFYTADSALYIVEKEGMKDEVFLYLGREPTNPIFNNIGEAIRQLISTGNYIPPKEDVEAVIKAESTLRIKLSDLKLQGDASEWRYFEINTADYDRLNKHQRKVAERVYGSGEDFVKNMKMLNKAAIRETTVNVLNPDYVKNNVPQNGAIARVSRLLGFVNDSVFYAVGRGVDNRNGLRGVRNVVAEGDTPKVEVDPITDAYKTILGANPDLALRAMTPQIATGLSGLLQTYNTQK